ncbi:MAG TPA: hypothetical protein VIG07_09840 [Methylomirabilota bacterium]
MASNLVILVVIAALGGAFAFVLFMFMGKIESRAHWGREAGIQRSQRLERRVFVVGVCLVLAMVAAGVAIQLLRQPGCTGKVVIVPGPKGEPLVCVCEQGRRGACFEAGP